MGTVAQLQLPFGLDCIMRASRDLFYEVYKAYKYPIPPLPSLAQSMLPSLAIGPPLPAAAAFPVVPVVGETSKPLLPTPARLRGTSGWQGESGSRGAATHTVWMAALVPTFAKS